MARLTKFFSRPLIQFLIVVSFAGLGMFAKLNDSELQPLGSAVHAAVSREILRTGDWLTLHWPHCDEFSDFYQFPPLFFWGQAITFKIFGINDITAKLTSSFFGFLTIVLTYLLGKILLDEFGGFLAAMTIILTPYFFRHSRKCELETILIFFITLGFFFFILSEKKNNPRWLLLTGLAVGLGLLTKGPPALAVWASIFVYYLLSQQSAKILNKYFWLGISLTIAIALGWIIPQIIFKGDALYQKYFINQIWWSIQGRSVQRNFWQQIFNYLFFFGAFFTYYLPWSITGIFGIIKIIKEKISQYYPVLCWVAVVWVGFTLAGYKDDYYLLAFWPGWATINALIWRHWLAHQEETLSVILAILTIIFTLLVFFTPIKLDRIRNPEFRTLGPVINSLTPPEEKIITYKLFYYDMAALLAWYADRGAESSRLPNPKVPATARAWKEHSIDTPEELVTIIQKFPKKFLLIKKEDYQQLPRNLQKTIFPLVSEGRFLLAITQAIPDSHPDHKK